MTYITNNHTADHHVAAWLKVTFGLNVERNFQYYVFVGDYIAPDEPYGTDDNSVFAAALDYAGCYDGKLFDKLNAIELGAQPCTTEQQRTDAIFACDKIIEASDKMQKALENILRILDNAAHGRDPNDGVKQ